MDPELAEIKELLRQDIEINKDTNRVVRSMHSAQGWARFFKLLWVVAILVASWYGYLYLQPYIEQIKSLYMSAQQTKDTAAHIEGQVADFIKTYVTLPAPQAPATPEVTQ